MFSYEGLNKAKPSTLLASVAMLLPMLVDKEGGVAMAESDAVGNNVVLQLDAMIVLDSSVLHWGEEGDCFPDNWK